MNSPYVYKLLTGKVKRLGDPKASHPMDRPWESGMFKSVTEDPVWLSRTGLKGDEVADKINHGGPEKAVFAYPVQHYEQWQKELNLDAIDIGGMGENMAVLNLDELTVCIGDTYRWGEAIIQVSQPRRPCWKPARRFRVIDFALRIQASGRTGWYFRVLKEGYVRAGLKLELLKRPCPGWTIAACNEVMYGQTDDLIKVAELASCEWLAPNWKRSLLKRLQGEATSQESRLYGPNREENL